MCGDLSDRDDFDPPPRRPDLWRERLSDEAQDVDESSNDAHAHDHDPADGDPAEPPAP